MGRNRRGPGNTLARSVVGGVRTLVFEKTMAQGSRHREPESLIVANGVTDSCEVTVEWDLKNGGTFTISDTHVVPPGETEQLDLSGFFIREEDKIYVTASQSVDIFIYTLEPEEA